MITKTTYEILNDIIKKFDFELIHAYMTINKWYWQNEKKASSIDDLKYTATSLLLEVIKTSRESDTEYTFSSTGGFKASFYPRCNAYSLEFIIERKSVSAN